MGVLFSERSDERRDYAINNFPQSFIAKGTAMGLQGFVGELKETFQEMCSMLRRVDMSQGCLLTKSGIKANHHCMYICCIGLSHDAQVPHEIEFCAQPDHQHFEEGWGYTQGGETLQYHLIAGGELRIRGFRCRIRQQCKQERERLFFDSSGMVP